MKLTTKGASKHGSTLTYTILCLCITFSSSLIIPVLSLYLTDVLKYNSFQVSFVFVILPLLTIICIQFFGKLSDGILQRPVIITISCIFGIISPIFLAIKPDFIYFCTIGFIVLSLYPIAYPQIFASAREFSLKYMASSVMYTTFLRALVSLSWSFGPPIAFFIATGYSFNSLFATCAIAYAIATFLTFFYLPHIPMDMTDTKISQKPNDFVWYKDKQVILLFIATVLMFTAFSAYIISMPLYLTKELQADPKLPGLILGLAAFTEIPLMFISARMVKKIGLKILVIFGAYMLVFYLTALLFATTTFELLAIQILSATFIALVSNLGMILFQELLSSIPGQATSFYINACTAGQILGGAMISLSAFFSYKAIYIVGIILSIIACIVLHKIKQPNAKI